MSARFKLQAIVAKSVFNQVAFDWEIQIQDFAIEREIRKQISPARNPSSGQISIKKSKPDFMDFLFDRSIGKSEKGFAKLFSRTAVLFLLIMRARSRPLFGFLNGMVKIQKTDISALKSVFEFRVRLQIRNPDFKIEIQISRSNAPSAFFFFFCDLLLMIGD